MVGVPWKSNILASPHMSRYVFRLAVAVFLGLLMSLTTTQAAVSVTSPLVLESTFLVA